MERRAKNLERVRVRRKIRHTELWRVASFDLYLLLSLITIPRLLENIRADETPWQNFGDFVSRPVSCIHTNRDPDHFRRINKRGKTVVQPKYHDRVT